MDISVSVSTEYALFLISHVVMYYLYYESAKKLGWELAIKTPEKHYKNVTNILVLSTVLFFLGNYAGRWSLSLVAVSALSMFGFGALAELQFLKTHISEDTVKGWSLKTKWFFATIFGTIVAMAFYHFKLAYTNNILIPYMLSFILILFVAYGIPIMISTDPGRLHFHHFLIFFILALFTRFNSSLSELCAAVCIGIYIQGSAMYENPMFGSTFMD